MPSARPRLAGDRDAAAGSRTRAARGERLGGRPVVRRDQEGDVVAGRQGRPAELAGGREAVLGALGHRAADDVVERRRQAGDDLARAPGGLGLEVRRERRLLVAGREGRAAGEGVEEDAAEGVDVGAGVERLAADLLGSEVGEGAGPARRRRARRRRRGR